MRWHLPPPGRITAHFTWQEAACKCCGLVCDTDEIVETATLMETLRKKLGAQPVHIASWCRCPAHNLAVGGAEDSFHMKGYAVDFTLKGMSPKQVQAALKDHNGGLGSYPGFSHVDRGARRRWKG